MQPEAGRAIVPGGARADRDHPDRHAPPAWILREECTVLLPGGGRRTVFLATTPGSTWVGATVEPASDLAMPGWGGHVIVRDARSRLAG